MTVRVKLFAMLRERAGGNEFDVDLPATTTVGEALAKIGSSMGIGDLIERLPLALAVNREIVGADTPLADGDELALLPPVSGGAGPTEVACATYVKITASPLVIDDVRRRVRHPDGGATVVFEGTTRTVDRLEYEAYEEMARERIAAIVEQVAARHDLLALAAEHRTGTVPRGEASVVVAATAGHRGPAFDGAREAIDRIKAEAPIWKREVEDAGDDAAGVWVDGTPLAVDRDREGPR